MYRSLAEQDVDVLAVLATKVEGEELTWSMVLRLTPRYYAVVSHAVRKSAECVLFIRNTYGLIAENVISCSLGRFVVCDLVFYGINWRIICVYAQMAHMSE